ncbi:MAG TPA: aminopeptidase [Steroidobacteraceae bacterium]|nr:aminopeptidase [Steroidobacteraceae bacterium]
MRGIVAECGASGRAWQGMAGRTARAAACVGCLSLLAGCYVMQAASGQLALMSRSRPVEKVIADPSTGPATRARLELAVAARDFAMHELELPDRGSYRKYADIGREYVLWNVVATPEFSLSPLRWCFPVAGCVNYRGYFHQSDAEAFAWGLAARGHDIVVEGVAAYSTLGHLSDPLLSSMLGWRDTRLAGTIFHELAHQRLYVAGDSAFNEAFASVVEEEGVRRWLASRGDAAGLAAYEASLRRREEFLALLRQASDRLRDLYRAALPVDEKRVEKNRVFGRLKYDYEVRRQAWGGYRGYDAWFAQPLSNASLASVATYRDCAPGLQRELAQAGSLESFYARADALARLPRAERHAAVCEK